MSDTIYLVHATVGVYSDRTEWIVAWYDNAEDARAHAAQADAEAKSIAATIRDGDMNPWSDAAIALLKTKLDPFRELYCGEGPSYCAFAVERGKWPFPLPEAQS